MIGLRMRNSTMSRALCACFMVFAVALLIFCCPPGLQSTAPNEATSMEPRGLHLQPGYNHVPRRVPLNCRSVRIYQRVRVGPTTADTQSSTANHVVDDIVDADNDDAEFQLQEVVIDSGCPELIIDVRDDTPDDGGCSCFSSNVGVLVFTLSTIS
jgi:hypothetical protein